MRSGTDSSARLPAHGGTELKLYGLQQDEQLHSEYTTVELRQLEGDDLQWLLS